MREIEKILKETLAGKELGRVKDLLEVRKAWENLPGPKVGVPSGFRGERLVVRVDSHPWAQELIFRKEEILEFLRETTGRRIEDLIIKVRPEV